MPTDAQKNWLTNVLGIAFDDRPAAPKGDPVKLWLAAKDVMDDRLNQLASALRAYDDPRYRDIADKGIFGVTKGATVALTKALIEYRAAPAAAGPKVREAAEAFRGLLISNPKLALIDDNPFGVQTDIGPLLGKALHDIEAAL